MLRGNGNAGSAGARNKHGALLRGLLRCAACDCGMTHTYTAKGTRRYRYYVCNRAQKHGWKTCPSPSVPAGEIERFVVDQIRCIGRDPALVAATVAETRRQTDEAIQAPQAGTGRVRTPTSRRRGGSWPAGAGRAPTDAQSGRDSGATGGGPAAAGGDPRGVRPAGRRRAHGGGRGRRPRGLRRRVGRARAAGAEQGLELLVDRVEFDGVTGQVAITFQPTGIKALGEALPKHEETAA